MKPVFKPNKLVYLANAYSPTGKLKGTDMGRLQASQRRGLEAFIGGQLKKTYDVTLILPIANSGSMADICDFDTGFDQWARDDYTYISKCDEVWVLVSDGWDVSYGVKEEIKFAIEQNIPVKYVNQYTLELTEEPIK